MVRAAYGNGWRRRVPKSPGRAGYYGIRKNHALHRPWSFIAAPLPWPVPGGAAPMCRSHDALSHAAKDPPLQARPAVGGHDHEIRLPLSHHGEEPVSGIATFED